MFVGRLGVQPRQDCNRPGTNFDVRWNMSATLPGSEGSSPGPPMPSPMKFPNLSMYPGSAPLVFSCCMAANPKFFMFTPHWFRRADLSSRVHCGNQKPHQNANDGDHHQQLDECKTVILCASYGAPEGERKVVVVSAMMERHSTLKGLVSPSIIAKTGAMCKCPRH